MIVRPSAEDLLLENSGTVHLKEELRQIGLDLIEITIKTNSALMGKAVGEVEIGGGFVIVAIKKSDGTLVRNPKMSDQLTTNDVLVLLGHADTLPQLALRVNNRIVTSYRGAAG
jgi:voltage-gated potassium channel